MIHAVSQNTLSAVIDTYVLQALQAPEEQTIDLGKLVDAIKRCDKRLMVEVPAMALRKFKHVRKSEIKRSIKEICNNPASCCTLYNTRTLILAPE